MGNLQNVMDPFGRDIDRDEIVPLTMDTSDPRDNRRNASLWQKFKDKCFYVKTWVVNRWIRLRRRIFGVKRSANPGPDVRRGDRWIPPKRLKIVLEDLLGVKFGHCFKSGGGGRAIDVWSYVENKWKVLKVPYWSFLSAMWGYGCFI